MPISRSVRLATLIAVGVAGVARTVSANEGNDSGDSNAYLLPAPSEALSPARSFPPRVCLDLDCQQRTREVYERDSKSAGGAFALELLFPGAGSLYASDGRGAALTWVGIGAGIGLMIYGLAGFGFPDQPDSSRPRISTAEVSVRQTAFWGGTILAVGARVYGVANAIAATDRHNAELANELFLAPSLSVVRAPDGQNVAYVPSLGGRF